MLKYQCASCGRKFGFFVLMTGRIGRAKCRECSRKELIARSRAKLSEIYAVAPETVYSGAACFLMGSQSQWRIGSKMRPTSVLLLSDGIHLRQWGTPDWKKPTHKDAGIVSWKEVSKVDHIIGPFHLMEARSSARVFIFVAVLMASMFAILLFMHRLSLLGWLAYSISFPLGMVIEAEVGTLLLERHLPPPVLIQIHLNDGRQLAVLMRWKEEGQRMLAAIRAQGLAVADDNARCTCS